MPSPPEKAIEEATALLNRINQERPAVNSFLDSLTATPDIDSAARLRQHYENGLWTIHRYGTACINTFKALLNSKKHLEQLDESHASHI